MIVIRLDVDYPYPSRFKSFLSTIMSLEKGKDYLKNSKIVAKMINESTKEVKAYWFFTRRTIPDRESLELMESPKHEIALHVVNDPYAELNLLEKNTKRKLTYYTIHGTARLLARIIWKRKIWQAQARVLPDFPLKSFHDFKTVGIDVLSYSNPAMLVAKMAENSIAKGEILHLHPEWLFKRGMINHRGPIYDALRVILEVDNEIGSLVTHRKVFARIARDVEEYQRDLVPSERFLEKLGERGIDVFTFLERRWCCPISNPSRTWAKTDDNVALLHLTTYNDWWAQIGKKTRNMVRKAEKTGLRIGVVEPNQKLAEGIWRIYNETPIRQERAFPHYGQSLQTVASMMANPKSTFVAAYLQDDLIGFIQLAHGDQIAMISQILSLQKESDKAVNNALIAKAVEVCISLGYEWLMYARMGNHPSLDSFKRNNGFTRVPITRYYVPITRRGRIAIWIGLHKDIKNYLPERVKTLLILIYNWVSRNRILFMRRTNWSG